MKELISILEGEIVKIVPQPSKIFINGITENSKEVLPGYLFIAKRGCTLNGEDFIPEAISKGAKAILRETPPDPSFKEVFQIQVRNLKKALFQLVFNYYEVPLDKLFLIGVTGTNGKTSVSYFTKKVLSNLGLKSAYLGTLFYELGDEILEAKETTPSLLTLGKLFQKTVKKGINTIVMEVSSHALDQDRIWGIKFDLGVFTNLSQDHLDYHLTMENYYQAKKKLFTHYLKPEGKAVISLETSYGERLAKELSDLPKLLVNDGEIGVEILERTEGLLLKVKSRGKEYQISTSLVGDYQAKNLMTLWGILLALGYEEEDFIKVLKDLKNPPGRLELVAEFKEAKILIDYAHTPSALEVALKSLNPLKKNRLIVLFGCGGNRDASKRPLMGKIASELSDLVILTSDNPRFEEPLEIIKDIKKGLNHKTPYEVIPDRKLALEWALKNLKKGDILLIAGKGHENYLEIKGQRIPFSDKEEILKIVDNLKPL
ncbi:MAG: UDP-N-acetylmuramoyl-L-alanyl-D-glutamate--2,6-diaminopimelate ligase [Thermodesulfobacteriaceae bacterium]|nr:UDP-N-acetylmuramoyl-L-alanyl-D-glutamate--2,6-diaminopimelate ligase [Thermodesulfobacteriaceae bacterium]